MKIEVLIPLGFAILGLFGLVYKVVIDRDMTLKQAVPIAAVFVLFGYVQVRNAVHYEPRLETESLLLIPVLFILLAQFYKNKLPRRR